MKANIQDIMFPVKEVPARITSKLPHRDTKDTGYKFIVREDTGDILSCMTDNYQLVSNSTVVDKSDKIITKQGGKLKEVQSFGKGARSIIKYEFDNHKIKISNGDICTPEIVWSNSYDGTINIIVTPKKRNCKVCKKVFVTNNTEYLSWKTKDDYRVFGWFCRKHYYKAKKLIKECK